jgi:hypothetical protein
MMYRVGLLISSIGIFLPYIFGLIGLSTMGPIAGGLFSSLQGSGIVAGSFMAFTQSFIMSGWVSFIYTWSFVTWIVYGSVSLIKKFI